MQEDDHPISPLPAVERPGETATCPPLWNPNAAASWSLFFSPAFGSFLQMKNWEALGQPDRAAASRRWFKISLVFLAVVFVGIFIEPDSTAVDALWQIAGLILLLRWYYANGKAQNAYILARHGKSYPRRGWAMPLGIGAACFVGFMLSALIIGMIIEALTS